MQRKRWDSRVGEFHPPAKSQIPQGRRLGQALFAYYRLDIVTLAAPANCSSNQRCSSCVSQSHPPSCASTHGIPYLPYPCTFWLFAFSSWSSATPLGRLLLQRFMHFFSVCIGNVCCFSSKTNATVLRPICPVPPNHGNPYWRPDVCKKLPSLTIRVSGFSIFLPPTATATVAVRAEVALSWCPELAHHSRQMQLFFCICLPHPATPWHPHCPSNTPNTLLCNKYNMQKWQPGCHLQVARSPFHLQRIFCSIWIALPSPVLIHGTKLFDLRYLRNLEGFFEFYYNIFWRKHIPHSPPKKVFFHEIYCFKRLKIFYYL